MSEPTGEPQQNRKSLSLDAIGEGILLIAVGILTLTPWYRDFARTMAFGPAPNLTPLLHLVTTIVAPLGFLAYGASKIFSAFHQQASAAVEMSPSAEQAIEPERSSCSKCSHYEPRETWLDRTKGYCSRHNRETFAYAACDSFRLREGAELQAGRERGV